MGRRRRRVRRLPLHGAAAARALGCARRPLAQRHGGDPGGRPQPPRRARPVRASASCGSCEGRAGGGDPGLRRSRQAPLSRRLARARGLTADAPNVENRGLCRRADGRRPAGAR